MNNAQLLKKGFYAIITIFFVIVFNYFLFRVLPGDPMAMMMRSPKVSQEAIENMRAMFGLNEPWYTQFFIYMKNLIQGDMGISFLYKKDVWEVIASRIFPTVILLFLAEAAAIVSGILLGILAARKRGTRLDVSALGFSLITYSMPTFWLGMILIVICSVNLRLFPTSGMMSAGETLSANAASIADLGVHLVLPVLTMALVLIGEYTLTMRNTAIDVLEEDYITTAKAKGFSDKYILRRHVLPNAMLPMITIIAINLGLIVGGAIQVETIFSWPGLGRLTYDALTARDYPLLQGLFLLVTVCVVLANFIADILYSYIDPRVKS